MKYTKEQKEFANELLDSLKEKLRLENIATPFLNKVFDDFKKEKVLVEEFKHEVGKVYKSDKAIIKCTATTGRFEECFSGYGINVDGEFDKYPGWLKQAFKEEATQEEFEAAFKKHADGKYVGKRVKCLDDGVITKAPVLKFELFQDGKIYYESEEYNIRKGAGCMVHTKICLMDSKGNWAEIVEEDLINLEDPSVADIVDIIGKEKAQHLRDITVTSACNFNDAVHLLRNSKDLKRDSKIIKELKDRGLQNNLIQVVLETLY